MILGYIGYNYFMCVILFDLYITHVHLYGHYYIICTMIYAF